MQTDIRGMRYGKLVAVEATDQRKNGYVVWHCHCDCGNEVLIDVRKLKRGTALDCGCSSIKGRTDLRGKRFGKLVVISQTGRCGPAGYYWLCQCDCGGTVEAPSRQLLSGYRKSCGCLSHPPRKQYEGAIFQNLTVLSYAGKHEGKHYWHCRCACGNELDVCQSNLQTGHTTSCGCQRDIRKNIHIVGGTNVEKIRSDFLPKTNTSGVRGVYYSKRQHRWVAQITFRGEKRHIGSFQTLEEASTARKLAEEQTYQKFLAWYDDRVNEEEDRESEERLKG